MSLRTKFTISNGNRELAVLLIISTHDFKQQRLDRGVIKKSSHDKKTPAIGSLRCSKFTFMIKSNSDWIAALLKKIQSCSKTAAIGSLCCKQQRLDRCVVQNIQSCLKKQRLDRCVVNNFQSCLKKQRLNRCVAWCMCIVVLPIIANHDKQTAIGSLHCLYFQSC